MLGKKVTIYSVANVLNSSTIVNYDSRVVLTRKLARAQP